MVTPRFLCTGGVDPYADPNTCKGKVALRLRCKPTRPSRLPLQPLSSTGDSGGPLIVHKRSRFIQVSAQVPSVWGTPGPGLMHVAGSGGHQDPPHLTAAPEVASESQVSGSCAAWRTGSWVLPQASWMLWGL